MGVITAIEEQKRRCDRKSIFVDGEFVAGAHEEVVVALGLCVGQSFDGDRLADIIRAETVRKARESALHLLGYRDRTKSEIKMHLIRRDYPEDIVDEIIDRLSRVELLDDEKFSRDWVRSRSAAKPMGRTRLAWELRSRGIDAPLIQEALESVDTDTEYALALEAASKKADKAKRDDPMLKKRLISFLRRRGFGWEVINRVIDRVCPEDWDSDSREEDL